MPKILQAECELGRLLAVHNSGAIGSPRVTGSSNPRRSSTNVVGGRQRFATAAHATQTFKRCGIDRLAADLLQSTPNRN